MLGTVPVGHGYLEGGLGLSTALGPWGSLEAGYRPADHLALFARGEVRAVRGQLEAGALAGARLTF